MKKRLLAFLLVLVMVAGFVPVTALAEGAAVVDSGTCGWTGYEDTLTWTLTDDGVLTISGTGDMMNYNNASLPPWVTHNEQIVSVVIEEGVTSVGSAAFATGAYQFPNLTSVSFPSTLLTIWTSAFAKTGLAGNIVIPASVRSIRDFAFNATAISSVTYTGTEAQWAQVSLGYTVFPNGVEIICEGGPGTEPTGPVIVSITATLAKTQFDVGEDFSGLTVTATMSDGTTQDVTDQANVTGYDSSSAGQYVLMVTVDGLHAYVTVTVGVFELASGTCGAEGDNLTWSLRSDGLLTISGTGAMADYAMSPTGWAGWARYNLQVKKLVVEEGVTSIGTNAFCHSLTARDLFRYMTEITIPVSVTKIGNMAFFQSGVKTVNYGGTEAQWNAIEIGGNNQPLTTATINFKPITAEDVIAMIEAIGEVTLGSEAAITEARAAYDALTDDEKALVTNYATLTAAEAALAELKQAQADQEAANAVITLITALPTEIALTDETAITEARAAYDALTDNQKALVTNYETLTAAETALAELQEQAASAQRVADMIAQIDALPEADAVTLADEADITAARTAFEALSAAEQAQVTNADKLSAVQAALQALLDQAAADAVIAAINAIGTVTLESEDAINAARTAYNALTDAQKALVTNIDTLTAAETALQTLQDQAAAGSVNDAISALPAADAITLADEAAVAAARAAYDALTPAQQALVDDSALVAAENAINQLKAEAVTNLIAALPAADAVTLDNEADIAAARAAYDALTDAQKALVDASALVAAEARIAELKFGTVKPVVKAENDKKTGKIQLTITPVAGAVKYHILVSDKADGTYKEVAAITGTTYTYEGTPGTQYFFKVRAESAAGVQSAESDAVSLFRLPAQVTSLKVKSKKKKEVTLTWKKVTGAKKYVIYMSKNGKTGWKKIGTVKTNKFTYKKAPAGKKMYFRVQAVTANGKKGEFSKAVSVKVKK